jgi:hypothetical protein
MNVGAILIRFPAYFQTGTAVVVPDDAIFADHVMDGGRKEPFLALNA